MSIECYQCYVTPPSRSPFSPAPEFEPLCSRFDGSDEYLVNCTQSTFCMTRTYRLHLRQGRILLWMTSLARCLQVVQWWSEREAVPSRCIVTRTWRGGSGGPSLRWWRRPTRLAVSGTRSGLAAWPVIQSGATVTLTGLSSSSTITATDHIL